MTSIDSMRIALISRLSHVHYKMCPSFNVLSHSSSTLLPIFCFVTS